MEKILRTADSAFYGKFSEYNGAQSSAKLLLARDSSSTPVTTITSYLNWWKSVEALALSKLHLSELHGYEGWVLF